MTNFVPSIRHHARPILDNRAITPQDSPILEQPSEVVAQILQRLDLREIGIIGLVCRKLAVLILEDNTVWKHIFSFRFPNVSLKGVTNFRVAYENRLNLFRFNLTQGVYASDTLKGPLSSVTSFVTAGKKLFAGSYDKTIKVWDLASHQCIDTLKGHEGSIKSLIIPDGQLFSACADGKIKVWDPASHQCIRTLEGHQDEVSALVAVDGKLISGSHDRTIKVWDLASHECMATLIGHRDWVSALAVANGWLFSASGEGLKVWDLASNQCIGQRKGPKGGISSLAIAGGKLFAGGFCGGIMVSDIKPSTRETTLQGHRTPVRAFAVGGKKLFSASNDVIKVWNLANGQCIATLKDFKKKESYETVSSLDFIDGKLFFACGSDLKIWDFMASHDTVLEEIAGQLVTGALENDEEMTGRAMKRFSRMPRPVQAEIHRELSKVVKEGLTNDYDDSVVDIVPLLKAHAILNYLAAEKSFK
jgi:WD40 repeat protein